MNYLQFFPLVLFISASYSLAAVYEDLPVPPKGYTWVQAAEINAALLQPDGWHFKSTEKDGTLAYFITNQPIQPDAQPGTIQFETGVSINVTRQLPKVKGMKPSAFARQYIKLLMDRAEYVVESTRSPRGGPFIGFGVVLRENGGENPIRVDHLAVGNDETGTLYVIIFESPLKNWDQEWPVAENVLKYLMLNPGT